MRAGEHGVSYLVPNKNLSLASRDRIYRVIQCVFQKPFLLCPLSLFTNEVAVMHAADQRCWSIVFGKTITPLS